MTPHRISQADASRAVERQLAQYRSMRHFDITPEPRGGRAGSATGHLPFLIQKHAARRLHYDFRLGWHGVLKSWAITKGPSYVSGDKRLAVQVEDHPMEYGGFEGTIPQGQYGGGTVMIWDTGEWTPEEDVDRGLEKGRLKFTLHGSKLKGKWALIRMRPRDGTRSAKPNWLLIKEHDEFERPADAPAITDEAPESAVTKRTIEQIAQSQDHVWDSETGLQSKNDDRRGPKRPETAEPAAQKPAPPRRRAKSVSWGSLLNSAPKEKYPGFIQPELAQQVSAAPQGEAWLHELKLDGYRIQIHLRPAEKGRKSTPELALLTRKGLDWKERMPGIAREAAALNAQSAILDGEVVALDAQGRTSFADLQSAFAEGRQGDLLYFAFDLLHLNGHNLRELPLTRRKEILNRLLASGDHSKLRYSEHLEGGGREVFEKACALGAEGIVSKLASSKYQPGRGSSWQKVKCYQVQEFVIGGFTPPSKGGHGIGALLLGYYEDGKLRYAGRSGTGFTQKTQQMLRARLDSLEQNAPPFSDLPRDAKKNARWVAPKLVAQISFTTWTTDNLVRQAAFKGLREDKPAQEVVREKPIAAPETPDAARNGTTGLINGNASGAGSMGSNKAVRRAARRNRHDGREAMNDLPITHPDKVLDEETGLTKRQLAEYYMEVSEAMLPHIADRPLSVVRCPEGSSKPCFFQKHVGIGTSDSVKSVAIRNRKTGKSEQFLTVDSEAGLVGLAQMGVLEIHPWGARNESLDTPDRIIFDLDPDAEVEWQDLAATALDLRSRLKQFKLESFVKSTGGKGLHVVVPILPEHPWTVIKQFAHAVVLEMEKENPALYITKMTKAARKGKIYLDYLRNDREATAVAPFSPRARRGAPVALPLNWKEIGGERIPAYTVSEFSAWRSRLKHDPWSAMAHSKQRIPEEALTAAGAKAPASRRAHR